MIQRRERTASVLPHQQRDAELVKRIGLVRPELEHAPERGLRRGRIAALPRNDPETEVRLPQRVVDRERALEDRLRSIEGRRLPREGSLAGALEVMLECRLAQTEPKSATVTKDLTTPLVRDQQVELAERPLPVAGGEQHAREVESHHARCAGRESVAIAGRRVGQLAGGVERRAVRPMELPARRACGDRARERLASRRRVTALERDDRERWARRGGDARARVREHRRSRRAPRGE